MSCKYFEEQFKKIGFNENYRYLRNYIDPLARQWSQGNVDRYVTSFSSAGKVVDIFYNATRGYAYDKDKDGIILSYLDASRAIQILHNSASKEAFLLRIDPDPLNAEIEIISDRESDDLLSKYKVACKDMGQLLSDIAVMSGRYD